MVSSLLFCYYVVSYYSVCHLKLVLISLCTPSFPVCIPVHSVFPEPNWGIEQAPSLDVARVIVRVKGEQATLDAKKSELEALRKDVSDLDGLIVSNTSKAAEKRAEAEALQKEAEKTRAEEALRKAEIDKAVESANIECQGKIVWPAIFVTNSCIQ